MRGCGGDNSIIMFCEINTIYPPGDSQSVSPGMTNLELIYPGKIVDWDLKSELFASYNNVEKEAK